MGKNRLFRTKLFMGYNKSDVDDYIALLEAEVERACTVESSQPIQAGKSSQPTQAGKSSQPIRAGKSPQSSRATNPYQPVLADDLVQPAVPATPPQALDREIEKLTEDLNYLLGNTKCGGTPEIEIHAKPYVRTKHEGAKAWNGNHTQEDQDIFILKEDS